jgi:hypothetical protein
MNRTNPAVVHTVQPTPSICWATCVLMAMVVKRNNAIQTRDWTAQSIVDRVFYGFQDHGAAPRLTKAALEAYGATNVTYTNGPAPWATITTSITNNRPLLVHYRWAGSGSHCMLIGGWEEQAGKVGFNWVTLHDPLQAAEQRVFYDRLSRGNYDIDGHRGEGNTWYAHTTFD